MLRFFSILVLTGVGLLAASAWWSGRAPEGAWPDAAVSAPDSARLDREGLVPDEPPAQPERAAREARPEAGPEPEAALTSEPEPAAVAKKLEPVPPPPRRVPPIPAPPIARLAEHEPEPIPEPALPEPIPAPFEPPADTVGESVIPEPAPFEEGPISIAEAPAYDPDAERYGEENVVYVEGNEDVFVSGEEDLDDAAPELDAEHSIAMHSSHDASADRIRRLLDVYESLWSRR